MTKYHPAIYFVILVEFFNRFSFSGIRALLSLYLKNVLLLEETASTVVYHVFIMTCFIVPILSAILADVRMGRFKTIILFSLICSAGHMLLFLTVTPLTEIDIFRWTMIALLLIAVGSGGIKPCMAAFGGDQFHTANDHSLLKSFFSTIYFIASFGSLIGILVTPMLRRVSHCFGREECYFLAFGVPALLVVMSTAIFVLGKPCYHIRAPKEKVIYQFFSCTMFALSKKIRSKGKVKTHWLDYADGQYDISLIRDMKDVFAIFKLFIFLPAFWSLIVQQGSRWTFQAARMNGQVMGIEILPDHVQALGPAMVLFLVPFFNTIVYPLMKRYNILHAFQTSPLTRMTIGGTAAILSFICAGYVEYHLQGSHSTTPSQQEGHVLMINTLPCDLSVDMSKDLTLPKTEILTITELEVQKATWLKFSLRVSPNCKERLKTKYITIPVLVQPQKIKTVVIGSNEDHGIEFYPLAEENLAKPLSGRPKLRLCFIREKNTVPVSISLYDDDGLFEFYYVGENQFGLSNYTEMHSGTFKYVITYPSKVEEFHGYLNLKPGGVYFLVLRESQQRVVYAQNFELVSPNNVCVLWLLPQYFLISVAEVLFSISGIEFCYSQAPNSMKTVVMAGWFSTVACGNLLVILITQLIFLSQTYEFLLFAVLLLLDLVLFHWVCSKYKFQIPETDRTIYGTSEGKLLLSMPSQMSIHS